jgi:hypothetical protein
MDSDRLNTLRRRYIDLYGIEPAEDDSCDLIEAALQIRLPPDVKAISTFYSGGLLGGIEHMAIEASGPADNLVDKTTALRSAIDLPQQFIVLAEQSESLIVLDVNSGNVTWLDSHDALNLAEGIPLTGVPTKWHSYVDFFEYLLEEEECRRADDSNKNAK